MNYLVQFYLVSLLTFLAKILPVAVTTWIARRVGDLVFLVLRKRRKIAFANIEKAFGNSLDEKTKRKITRAAFQSAALSVTELFIVQKIKKDTKNRFKLFGNEHLEAAFSKNKGVVLAISHLGSWEYLSFLPYLTGQSWAVIVKDIKNPYIDRAYNAMRREMNVVPIPKESSVRTILKELKEGRGIAILIDQWAGDEGLWIDFFGSKTSTTSIPARLAEKTGCTLITGYCLRTGSGHYEIHIEPPVEWDRNDPDWETSLSEKLNRVLEKQIRQYPEQWLWGHRRWKEKNTVRIPR